jgi:hypothetical protein
MDRELVSERGLLCERNRIDRSGLGAMQASKYAIHITAAWHDNALCNPFKDTHEHFSILAGECQHVQYYIRMQFSKLADEFVQIPALAKDVVD